MFPAHTLVVKGSLKASPMSSKHLFLLKVHRLSYLLASKVRTHPPQTAQTLVSEAAHTLMPRPTGRLKPVSTGDPLGML